ncbi:MAG: ABC transporter substrate-binding protein, partial [Rhodospirillaceae bacterium]|nr:ABC transporter substrate-binding protein [Rhodospirillaceae bacterium]
MIRFPARVRVICAVLAAGLGVGPAAAETTLRMAITTLPPQDGHPFSTSATPTITTTGAIFDGLTRITADGSLRPWLATSWRNLDANTWRFALRDDVVFSNGAPFDAAAVKFAVDYLATRAVPGKDNLARDLPPMVAARVVDARTIDIVTKDPVPIFPRYAAALLVPEPAAFERLGKEGFQKAPVGTGPFEAVEFAPAKVSFRAHARSWRKPRFARMELLELPDPTVRVQALITDQIDIATGLAPEDVATLKAAGHQAIGWRDIQVSSISLVTTRNLPFNDVRVRRALNLAVNRQPIVDVLMLGSTVPANQPAAANVLGFDPTIPQYPYDPAEAKALLAEAGYPNGFSFVLETTGAGGSSLSVYQQVASDLAQVGVKMEIRALPGPQYLRNLFQTGEFADAITVPWLASPTADVMRPILIHSCRTRIPWYCDADLTPKIEAALAEWDEAKALALRKELGRIYHDRAPAIFLYESALFAGLRKGF